MIKKKIGKYIAVTLILSTILQLTGCDIEIFEDKSAKYIAKALEKNELENGKYYVKKDTKFYQIHECDASSDSTDVDASKCAWMVKDEGLLPEYFCNELIAKVTTEVKKDQMSLERYKDCGYSIGIYGAEYKDGYIQLHASRNVIKDTDAKKCLENDKSSNIMIETINGQPVTESMLSEAGFILGMEKDASYEITFYAGTYYGKTVIKADTHFLQSFEIFNVKDYEMTKNGYLAIRIPEDLESGYYKLGTEGFFKYYNFKREELASADVDFNIPYYDSEEDQLAAYSQQFVFNLDVSTSDMSVKADFVPQTVTNISGIVKMMLTSPDGKRMIVEKGRDEGTISCDMVESMPGKWIVNIAPQSMTIKDVQIVSNKSEAEATKETYDMVFEEDLTGVVITLQYEGEGIVTAQVIDKDNNSYDMVPADKTGYNTVHKLKYNFAYLPKGEYKVNVYHYPDTKILGTDYYLSEDVREVEIITVEE